jgi:hypothetical protein
VVDALAVDEAIAHRPVALEGAAQGLDRDHVGAQVAQDLRAHGTGKKVVEADHPGA